jgi:hypothetical protein
MRTPEGRIKKQIRDWLREHGAYVFSPVQQGYGQQSVDLLVCWHSWFVGIEVKAPKGKTTARQDGIMEQIRTAGGGAFVAYDLEAVKRYFDMHND